MSRYSATPKNAKPFLEAILKIKIQKISVVGEAHLETDPRKKRIRFDIFAKENLGDAVGRTFDIEKRAKRVSRQQACLFS